MGLLNWLGLKSDCEATPVSLTDANFHEEVMKSDEPVMIDFWNNGCQPCMQLVPTIKRIACKYEGKLKVAELNTSNNPKSAAKMGIRGTPTVVFIHKGRVIERVVGLKGQLYYEEIIETEFFKDEAK